MEGKYIKTIISKILAVILLLLICAIFCTPAFAGRASQDDQKTMKTSNGETININDYLKDLNRKSTLSREKQIQQLLNDVMISDPAGGFIETVGEAGLLMSYDEEDITAKRDILISEQISKSKPGSKRVFAAKYGVDLSALPLSGYNMNMGYYTNMFYIQNTNYGFTASTTSSGASGGGGGSDYLP